MLCAKCMSMFLKSATRGLHYQEHEGLATAARNGCKICHYLLQRHLLRDWRPLKYEFFLADYRQRHWQIQFCQGDEEVRDIPIWQRPQDLVIFVQVAASSDIPFGYDEFLSLVDADLESTPSRVRMEFPPLQDIPDNTGHEKVAQIAKKWLAACKDNHDCQSASGSQEAGWYPKRLIQVGNESQPPRLVSPTSDTLEGTYAALSHCWGENPDFLMLTSDTLAEFRDEISLSRLPASFRDAIITCRRMEIPYIWIDSLCILQSGPGARQDWLLHSEIMHQVYQNCELNISIDVSSDPHGGAFRSRDQKYLQDCYVWTPFHALPQCPPLPNMVASEDQYTNADEANDCNGVNGSGYLQENTKEQPVSRNLCAVYTQDDFAWPRIHLPLNTRAWVFQERLLSPRTLHFSLDRITWECGQDIELNEYLAESMSYGLATGFDCLYQATYTIRYNGHLSLYYHDLVFEYTVRQLSYPDEDKLVAFAAVARRCSSYLGRDYFAGIFRSTMPMALLWEADVRHDPKRSEVTYRAPSWSWASLDCRIIFRAVREHALVLANVEEVTVDLVDPENPFGQVKSASLTMTGPLVASKALLPLQHNTEEANSQGNYTVMGQWFEVIPDRELVRGSDQEWPEQQRLWIDSQDDMFLLAITEDADRTEGRFCIGILIQKGTEGKFTRVGFWKGNPGFVSKHADTVCEFKSETVTIV
ncbi:hypothetical protein NW762_014532 [Fusarium torreyae]|uniref:C2H2-type domain-containing protein n=1 Tax=Fusarium torreyae TaxID=1237075 RepID=A0A9W8V9C3_9HYPO|nr:hypothetical protein NW762_014532 [Fusarium torreyae]